MSVWMVLYLASAVVKEGLAGLASDKQGPYDIKVRFVEDCSEGDNTTVPMKIYPRMQRVNRTTVFVSGTIVLGIPIDNDMKWTLTLDQKTSQGFKEKFFFTDFQGQPMCQCMKEFGDENDYKRLFNALKGGEVKYTDCPLPAGIHEFEVDVLIEPFKKFPSFFYNTYRAIVRFYRDLNNPPDGCLRVIADLIPKKKKTG